MPNENKVQPLHFCCAGCLHGDRKIGVRWDCGHVNCCALTATDQLRCPVQGCSGKEVVQRGWFDPSERPSAGQVSADLYGEWKKVAPRCLLHPAEVVGYIQIARKQRGISQVGCKRCHRSNPNGYYSVQNLLRESAPFLSNFVRAFKSFDETVRGRDQGVVARKKLRAALATFVADELSDFVYCRAQDAILGRPGLEMVEMKPPSPFTRYFRVQNVVLERLGDLLLQLARHGGGFSEGRLLERAEEFLAKAREAQSPSEAPRMTQAEVDRLMGEEWPFHGHPGSRVPGFWDEAQSFPPRSTKTPQKRAHLFNCWSRSVAKWRRSALNSRILKGRDSHFAASVLPLEDPLQLLARITEEEGSGLRFREATGDKTRTIVFVQSGDNRFGCWRGPSWKELSPSYTPACRFFSLNFRTAVDSAPNMLDRPVPVCPTLGPFEAGYTVSQNKFFFQTQKLLGLAKGHLAPEVVALLQRDLEQLDFTSLRRIQLDLAGPLIRPTAA